jgi:hypothetical protein
MFPFYGGSQSVTFPTENPIHMKIVASIFRIAGALIALNGLLGGNLLGVLVGAGLIAVTYFFPKEEAK